MTRFGSAKLISRILFRKWRVCHSVEICKFFPHDILQKFRQINFFTKELYCKSIWRKIFAVGENFRNFHTVYVRTSSQVLHIFSLDAMLKYCFCEKYFNFSRWDITTALRTRTSKNWKETALRQSSSNPFLGHGICCKRSYVEEYNKEDAK